MKFITWIIEQSERNDKIGDLSRDIKDDTKFPNKNSSFEKIKEYLEMSGACDDAMITFKEAKKEYQTLITR